MTFQEQFFHTLLKECHVLDGQWDSAATSSLRSIKCFSMILNERFQHRLDDSLIWFCSPLKWWSIHPYVYPPSCVQPPKYIMDIHLPCADQIAMAILASENFAKHSTSYIVSICAVGIFLQHSFFLVFLWICSHHFFNLPLPGLDGIYSDFFVSFQLYEYEDLL